MKNLLKRFAFTAWAVFMIGMVQAQDLWDGKTISSSFQGGSGTDEDPYQIRTGAQLMFFIQQINAGNDFSGKTVKLMNDINLNNKAFHAALTFAGTFDGGSHFLTVCFNGFSKPLFNNVSGKIHHLGVNGRLSASYWYIYESRMAITDTLAITGRIESCIYFLNTNSLVQEISTMAIHNAGTVRNCYAKCYFSDYVVAGYKIGTMVCYNLETGLVENFYTEANSYGSLIRDNQGTLNNCFGYNTSVSSGTKYNEAIEYLNRWVNEHPGYSQWSLTGYALEDFNFGDICQIEFIDTLFGVTIPSKMVAKGVPVGELPIPEVDCTFKGWQRMGKEVSDTDKVESPWALFATWQQSIRKQPNAKDMSLVVDDISHATFQWYAIYGTTEQLGEWKSTNHASNSFSADTIIFTGKAGQELKFSYNISSEESFDVFTAQINGEIFVTSSGMKSDDIIFLIPKIRN
ncbi:MAG: hypothetical protein IJK42_07965 [Prevotella sp.]|nr:hypothetical protein [Prevotella sp.]